MRQCASPWGCDAPLYLHGDHLGSMSLTTSSNGTPISQSRYMPFGDIRWESSEAVTDFAFTGQRAEQGFGLADYNARYYSPGWGGLRRQIPSFHKVKACRHGIDIKW